MAENKTSIDKNVKFKPSFPKKSLTNSASIKEGELKEYRIVRLLYNFVLMTSVLLIKYISLNFACCRWTSNRKDLNIRFYKTCSYSKQMFNKSKEKVDSLGIFLQKTKYIYISSHLTANFTRIFDG